METTDLEKQLVRIWARHTWSGCDWWDVYSSLDDIAWAMYCVGKASVYDDIHTLARVAMAHRIDAIHTDHRFAEAA